LTKEASIKTKNHSRKENERSQKRLTKEGSIKAKQSMKEK
jgi:hypothetical protein